MPIARRTAIAAALLPAMQVSLAQAQPQVQAPRRDVEREERNRRLVVAFYEAVFVRHDLSAAERYLSEDYRQHNPRVPDGRAAFVAVFSRILAANPQARSRIVRSAADGDLVFLHVHSQSNPSDRGRAIVDIFRVEGDRIVEHWDVIQEVPETAANGNTMF
ncbi:nuclear transport factor 2 family protein [Roseomonas sp. CCTCC AB2023176]|uniref:nuclear transport factor 2 family protein n=1 Tax=Roseomonas sp. CCTCC AB2023176 TaxID=3342640 RepID=UPI0035E22DDE